MYSIGQLSKDTGVTVRTLDYYDEIDLLKPSSETTGGHRLYSEEDVMRLQQVLALKFMGFSLQRIKGMLDESSFTWEQSIQQQLEMVQQEKDRLNKLEQALESIIHSRELEGKINIEVVFGIIQWFQQGPESVFKAYEKHLDEKDVRTIAHMNDQISEEDQQTWVEIIQEFRSNLESDPGSEKIQQLAARFMEHVHKMFGGDEALIGKMGGALDDFQEGIAFYPLTEEVIQFIKQAVIIMEEKEDTGR